MRRRAWTARAKRCQVSGFSLAPFGRRPITFIASAIIEPTSATLVGSKKASAVKPADLGVRLPADWLQACNQGASTWTVSTLHVRNVPEPIHRALRKRARERGSSVSAETIRLLGRALRVDRPGIRELLDEIERARPVARKGTLAAADLVREDRDGR